MPLTAATLATWILASSGVVASEVGHVDVSRAPRVSRAWAEAAAAEILADPLLPDPKTDAIHMLVYAWHESTYRDAAVGDGGMAVCSLQVHVDWRTMEGWTRDQLLKEPKKCIHVARRVMRQSFKCDPDHPMACYAGGKNSTARKISDSRAQEAKDLLGKLPPLQEPDGET